MAQAVHETRGPLSILNTDGNAHPRQNALTAVTLVLGIIAISTAFSESLHLIASWAGLIGIVVGVWSMMVSATTAERFVTVLGLGAAALGFYLGVANGGPFGGVIG